MFKYLSIRRKIEVLNCSCAHKFAIHKRKVVRESCGKTTHLAIEIGLIAETLIHQVVFGILPCVGGVEIDIKGAYLVEKVV